MSISHRISSKLRQYPQIKKMTKNLYQNIGNFISDKESFPKSIELISDESYEHLFGYYDKSPWDISGTKIIYLRVKDASRSVASVVPGEIILKSLETNREEVVAHTRAWNVQQGCMLQWYGPEFNNKILYNDFRNGIYCSIILDIITKEECIVDMPLYSVSLNGEKALTLDFSRLHSLRPGYGYKNVVDSTAGIKCPETPCIWLVDIKNNSKKPIIEYTQLYNFETKESMHNAYHKVNHIMINPSGDRFMFLHRWIKNGIRYDRLITCNLDGSDMYNLLDNDIVSHSNWKDDQTIITYGNGVDGKNYYMLKDKSQECKSLKDILPNVDGHPSFSPDGRYLITDTYPDFRRKQHLYLFDLKSEKLSEIAEVYSSKNYINDTRCDLHPRWKRNSKEICFDGAQRSKRQVYTINV